MYNSIGGFIVNVNDGGHCQGAAHCHLVMSDDGVMLPGKMVMV